MASRTRKLVAAAVACVAACALLTSPAGSAPAAATPPLVGAIQVGTTWALRPLNPQTLAPLPGSWSQPVGRNPVVARSPLGTGVVAAWGRAIVVDARTGRVARRFTGGSGGSTLYWLGAELPLRARSGPLLVAETAGVCWSQGCGSEYEVVGTEFSEGWEAGTEALLRTRIVLGFEPPELTLLGPPADPVTELTPYGIRLPRLPPSAPVRVVADVAKDRLFAVSSAGMVARVDAASSRPAVSYHRVPLNGRPFEAAWAGQGRIALWGEDGLGTIDTRTWTTKSVAPTATGVVPTRYGLAVWADGRPGGVTVYRPDGARRFSVLVTEVVRSAESLGRYLYVRAARRYAVDLVTGRVVGRVRSDARLALPSLVPLP